MTKERLDAIRARDAARPRGWHYAADDAAIIVSAPDDIRDLLAAIDERDTEIGRLQRKLASVVARLYRT